MLIIKERREHSMGIPVYFSHIAKKHARILQKWSPSLRIDNLYMDCNSIIYNEIYATAPIDCNTATIIRKVCLKIDEQIRQFNPAKSVFIAFDGVAPRAKMDQQKGRRYKSQYQANALKRAEASMGIVRPVDPWNTSVITPGTPFMQELSSAINEWFKSALYSHLTFDILISCSDEIGEGEHKLFAHIRENPTKHATDITVIYGLDADLIMLSLCHLSICPNLLLFRETPEFIKSIRADLEPNELYVLDISQLAEAIQREMRETREMGDMDGQKGGALDHSLIYDYIFLCFLLGNDFLPHFPAINIRTGGIQKCLDAYRETMDNDTHSETGRLYLIQGGAIQWNHVQLLIQWLAKREETYFQTEAKARDRFEKQQKEKMERETNSANIETSMSEESRILYVKQASVYFDLIPTRERKIEYHINSYKPGWRNRYYASLFKEGDRDAICRTYLQGLEWTFRYYTSACPDWRWGYEYAYPPLLGDLALFLTTHAPLADSFAVNRYNPVSPLVQMCYVLPTSSLAECVPASVVTTVVNTLANKKDTSTSTSTSEVKGGRFLWAYCKYFWESHVVLPSLSIEELDSLGLASH